jgi:hypothetical protein
MKNLKITIVLPALIYFEWTLAQSVALDAIVPPKIVSTYRPEASEAVIFGKVEQISPSP